MEEDDEVDVEVVEVLVVLVVGEDEGGLVDGEGGEALKACASLPEPPPGGDCDAPAILVEVLF